MPRSKVKKTTTGTGPAAPKSKPGTAIDAKSQKPSTAPEKPSTGTPQVPAAKPKSETTSAKLAQIREAVVEGEFSMSELAKKLDWRFQKVRQACLKVTEQEKATLKSVSRGRWVMEKKK